MRLIRKEKKNLLKKNYNKIRYFIYTAVIFRSGHWWRE